ncbi:predicted protein [Sclerotinia sclerotiorum 1980 UF-70]|uniref:Uncharacterized protein n=1 Tax=Sclerotinia sclerotiorum (strain ATCC 18683 / 1980 / Ss-1) TaxID=665079 RepID=A7EIL4_SCLS1|nr:predicted protein [Sclerotinia sclerotiorum 1980 UF-70]EDO02680.1 predicted protein [Sclerotinia sclerotiorum 1980 UF-70]
MSAPGAGPHISIIISWRLKEALKMSNLKIFEHSLPRVQKSDQRRGNWSCKRRMFEQSLTSDVCAKV